MAWKAPLPSVTLFAPISGYSPPPLLCSGHSLLRYWACSHLRSFALAVPSACTARPQLSTGLHSPAFLHFSPNAVFSVKPTPALSCYSLPGPSRSTPLPGPYLPAHRLLLSWFRLLPAFPHSHTSFTQDGGFIHLGSCSIAYA